MSSEAWAIYVLRDPRTNEIRYVGWAEDAERRLRKHVEQAKYEKTKKSSWIKSLLAKGHTPIVEVLEYGTTPGGWAEAERFWIAYHWANGWSLTNGTDGGDGAKGRVVSAAQREKVRQALLGRPKSKEARRKMSLAKRGRPRDRAAVEKTANAHRGKTVSLETREKIRLAKLGKKRPPFSDEWRAALSRAHKRNQNHKVQ